MQPTIPVNHTRVRRQRSTAFLTCVSPDTGIDINWFFNYKPLNLMERTTLSPEEHRLTINSCLEGRYRDLSISVRSPIPSAPGSLTHCSLCWFMAIVFSLPIYQSTEDFMSLVCKAYKSHRRKLSWQTQIGIMAT